MPQESIKDQTLKEERTDFRQQVFDYSKNIGKYSNYVVIILFLVILYHQINPRKQESEQQNKIIADSISQFVQLIIVVIAFVMAITPEAISLAFSICIMSYQSQEVFYDGKLTFQNYKSLEMLGKTNCIIINISQLLKRLANGEKTEDEIES